MNYTKNRKIIWFLIIAVVCVMSVLLILNRDQKVKDQNISTIPQQVMSRYTMFASEFPEPLFIGISVCNSDRGRIYVSEVSTGYTGMRYFYNEDGIEIASDIISDIPTENTRSGVQTFDCTRVR